ncbi:MAG: hypothetical protein QXP97_01445 [Desulfurococcus sp.]
MIEHSRLHKGATQQLAELVKSLSRGIIDARKPVKTASQVVKGYRVPS